MVRTSAPGDSIAPLRLSAILMSSLSQGLLPLRDATLQQLGGSALPVPRYDRKCSRSGIVHIGVGGFNRSHLAVYLDDLLGSGGSSEWGEFGIGLLSGDKALHTALAAQDFLYGVMERDTACQSYRVIGSLTGHAYAPEETGHVINRLSAEDCKIISLTVTEGGYFLEDSTGRFLADDTSIERDLQNPDTPATWLGYVAAAAERRIQLGRAPFTLLSCDNLQSNGNTARAALLAFAGLRSDALQNWIAANVTFPNSMVDRITPRTTQQDRDSIAQQTGVDDLCPVVTEPFRQWVLEDKFAAGRPNWEAVGVQMSDDVDQYEKTKMRLLNGGHLCLAYCSALLSLEFVADAIADPLIHRLLAAFLAEVRVTLQDLPGIDLEQYIASIVHRFSNVTIRDQIPRICSDGTAKMSKYIVPALTDLLASGGSPKIIPLIIATWLLYSTGRAESGTQLVLSDPGIRALDTFLNSGAAQASLALSVRSIFGDLASRYPNFAKDVQQSLDSLRNSGIRSTIEQTLNHPHRS